MSNRLSFWPTRAGLRRNPQEAEQRVEEAERRAASEAQRAASEAQRAESAERSVKEL